MARRLSFAGYDGSKPVAVANVPAPLRTGGRAHSLTNVLEIMLRHAGLSLGYDAIMGLCGLAFRTPPWPAPPSPAVAEAITAITALSGALGDCLTIIGADEAPSDEAVFGAVETSIGAGRPCIALGWGSNKDHWSIITGHDRGKARLIGHCLLDAPRRQYESWPPTLRMLVAITGEPRPRGPQAVTDALQTGARRLVDEGAARSAAWVVEMRSRDIPPDAAHEQAVELLADARAAAARFAEQVAELERVIPAAWLRRAAEQWHELVRSLEARGIPHSRAALMTTESAEGREDWAELLENAATMEEKAAKSVRLSATADFLPEEVSEW